MTFFAGRAGIAEPGKVVWAGDASQWKRGKAAWIGRDGSWLQFYRDEIVATLSGNHPQVNAPSLFPAAEWANPDLLKRIAVAEGARLWSYTQGVPAFDLGTGRGGLLEVEIAAGAEVLGHAGARNSGIGGTAIKVRQGNISLRNAGDIRGGGGGAGRGGTGGAGSYSDTTAYMYDSAGSDAYLWEVRNNVAIEVRWNGAVVYSSGGNSTTASVGAGGWIYQRGAFQGNNGGKTSGDDEGDPHWQVRRTRTVGTTGGAGGFGGRGTGFDASMASEAESGLAGAAGGTNAGAGGQGGNGGGWGAGGASGASGANGNAGSGLPGLVGGLSGFYIDGMSLLTSFENTGSVLGRVQS